MSPTRVTLSEIGDLLDAASPPSHPASIQSPASAANAVKSERGGPDDPLLGDDVRNAAVSAFDYEQIPAEYRAAVRAHEAAILGARSRARIEAGRHLLAIRAIIMRKCRRNTWSKYLKSREYSETSGRNYMRAAKVANRLEAKNATVAGMAPTALYATYRAPDEVQREIEQLLDQGATIKGRQVGAMVVKHQLEANIGDENSAESNRTDRKDNAKAIAGRRRHGSKQTEECLAAGNEVLARLREFFTDEEIRQLNAIWQKAGPALITRLLDGVQSVN